jgi:hypothetical protein
MTLFSKDPDSRVTYSVMKTPRCGFWGPKCVPSWVTRRSYNGLAGGEILPSRCHRDGGMNWCRLGSGLDLYRLVVPPLQPGVTPQPFAAGGSRVMSRFYGYLNWDLFTD